MKYSTKPYVLSMLLTVIFGSQTFAQEFAASDLFKKRDSSHVLLPFKLDAGKDIVQFNEYTSTGDEQGNFYENPLMLDGKQLDYAYFSPQLKGELTVVKGAPKTGYTTEVPFRIYLRREGNRVLIPGNDISDKGQMKIEISRILQHAKPGDQLIIEAVNRVDGRVKRILKLPNGC
jgi:hypothetical protein